MSTYKTISGQNQLPKSDETNLTADSQTTTEYESLSDTFKNDENKKLK